MARQRSEKIGATCIKILIEIQQFGEEIYIILDDNLIGIVKEFEGDNYMIEWENGDKTPGHSFDCVKRYVLRNYKEHLCN